MGFSLEEERRLRQLAVSAKVASAEGDVEDAIKALDTAMDSRDISIVMQKVVARRILKLMGEDKVGAGDLVRLMSLVNDRADGKVADKIEVEMTTSDEAIAAVKELVRAGLIQSADAERELRLLGVSAPVIDVPYTVTSAPVTHPAPDIHTTDDGVLE